MTLVDQVAYEATRVFVCPAGQLRCSSTSCNSWVDLSHQKTFTAVVGLPRDNDLTGSVDHAQCCMLHATAWSKYGRRAFKHVERTTGRGTAMGLNCQRDEKNTTSFHRPQRILDTTRSRWHNKFSSHSTGNTKPGWTGLFSPSSWRGRLHACRRPHLFQWRTREREGIWWEQKVDGCFLLRSGRLVHSIFV